MAHATCSVCASEMTDGPPSKRYCSRACRNRRGRKPQPERSCDLCGATYLPHRKEQRFCSTKCSANGPHRRMQGTAKPRPKRKRKYAPKAKVAGPRAPKPCGMCGLMMPGCRRSYCSESCYNVFGRPGGDRCAVYFGDCLDCGSAFTARRPSAKFCSSTCAKRHRKRQRRYLKRAAVGGGDHGVTLRSVAERDGWRCHICGLKTNRTYRNGRDRDPTIDHLIPVSDGGSHTWDNVALAHNRCNWERGADGAAQLLLVG